MGDWNVIGYPAKARQVRRQTHFPTKTFNDNISSDYTFSLGAEKKKIKIAFYVVGSKKFPKIIRSPPNLAIVDRYSREQEC